MSYDMRKGWYAPRFGSRFQNGVWPPSKKRAGLPVPAPVSLRVSTLAPGMFGKPFLDSFLSFDQAQPRKRTDCRSVGFIGQFDNIHRLPNFTGATVCNHTHSKQTCGSEEWITHRATAAGAVRGGVCMQMGGKGSAPERDFWPLWPRPARLSPPPRARRFLGFFCHDFSEASECCWCCAPAVDTPIGINTAFHCCPPSRLLTLESQDQQNLEPALYSRAAEHAGSDRCRAVPVALALHAASRPIANHTLASCLQIEEFMESYSSVSTVTCARACLVCWHAASSRPGCTLSAGAR